MVAGRGGARSPVLAVARHRLRRAPAATAALLVLTGVAAAAPMAVWSAARQTSTAFDHFVDEADVPAATVFVCPPGYDPDTGAEGPEPCFARRDEADLQALRSLPGVTAAAHFQFRPVAVEVVGTGARLPTGIGLATLEGGAATATVAGDPIVVAGRLPSVHAADEVALAEPGARSYGIGVGDRVALGSAVPPEEGPAPPPVEAEVVGVVRTPVDLLPIGLASAGGPGFHARAGWVEAHGDAVEGFGAIVVWLADGDTDALLALAGRHLPEQRVLAEVVLAPDDVDTIRHATGLESRAGLAVAATAALAVTFLVGQSVSRQSRGEAVDAPVLLALGMTKRQLAAAHVARWSPVAGGGALLAVLVTVAATGLGPIGVARRGTWTATPYADWPVLAIGAAVTVAVVLAGPLVGSRLRRTSGDGAGAGPSRAAAVGPPGLRTGIGLAWASLRRGAALPLVSAVVATGLAVAGVIAAAGAATSLRLVTDDPPRFGAPWDALVSGGGGVDSVEAFGSALAGVPGVVSAAGLAGTDVTIGDDDTVWIQAHLPVGDLPATAPVIVSGRAPTGDREITLGTRALRDAGVRIGDEVTLAVEGADAARSLPFRVVGVTMVTDGFEPNVGDGGLVTPEGLAGLDPFASEETEVGVEVVDGPGRQEALATVRRTFAGAIIPFPVPATLANAERIAGLPLVLAVGGALLAAVTFVHALVVSVHRNGGELAVCRVLGFTRGQVRTAVVTQATLLALGALAVGVPLGVIGGRWGWRALARTFGVVSGPLVPASVVLASAAVALLVANLAAAPPARWATRRRPGDALRTE